ncbi:MAG TPA: NAD(P)(+) transhydrogenase (Re/Si-specific) subunit beta [Candidatus Dormibacteraeota bacterium]|nr:NAD(P)(+) transhydrogenase (Re/Si-specific) subunit beta [Candidatus Dormibacteraeota bacterium]
MIHYPQLVALGYLSTVVLFVFGIRLLGSPATARRGNLLAAAGMLVALVVTFVGLGALPWAAVLPAMLAGTAVGAVAARSVRMTAMPQMVALFNGMGGGAAALIGADELVRRTAHLATGSSTVGLSNSIPILLGCLIGSISFSGSLIAFCKLQGIMRGSPITFPNQRLANGALLLVIVALGVVMIAVNTSPWLFVAFEALALIFGVAFVLPIGGADMPVIISLLNSFTGLAAAISGFVLDNEVLIVAGALVGASGTILTQLMSRAMNRSLANVLFSAFGSPVSALANTGPTADQSVHSVTAEDVAILLGYARQVIFVPGYGMAVAKAQHDVRELATQLEKRGVQVKYAIHPVAGRMPGHMNVLLAEADVPYTQLFEMDDINQDFPRTDVAVVIGANDVTNPAARSNPASPIYGMPILNVDQAANVVVLKRSMNPGFAGVENELYYNPKTLMLFGDARDSVIQLVAAIKELVPMN